MNDKRIADVVIVGGGASGLAAAAELGMSSPGLEVLVIEKLDEPGRKLRATGSGRCNISNTSAEGFSRIMEFFTRIGLATRVYGNGLVYPYSESAADVVSLLTERAEELGVRFACGEEVTAVRKREKEKEKDKEGSAEPGGSKKDDAAPRRFEVESVYKDKNGEQRIITFADYVILASGGKAGPMYGTTGDGYRLARSLGHSIVTPVPALTGIECMEWDEGSDPCALSLAGTRTSGVVSLYRDAMGALPCYSGPFFTGEYSNIKPVFVEKGEIQFTKYGLSGICVFNMTRFMRYKREDGEGLGDFFIKINLFPEGSIADHITESQRGAFADSPLGGLLCTILKKPVADYVLALFAGCCISSPLRSAEEAGRMPVSKLGPADVKLLSEIVHGLEFYPVKLRGWKDAQVTSGGVSLDEIDDGSCESKKARGLYITGELADRDFECGGFNLSNAWITGLAAADAIAADAASEQEEGGII